MNNYLIPALDTVDMIRILCIPCCIHLGKELIRIRYMSVNTKNNKKNVIISLQYMKQKILIRLDYKQPIKFSTYS